MRTWRTSIVLLMALAALSIGPGHLVRAQTATPTQTAGATPTSSPTVTPTPIATATPTPRPSARSLLQHSSRALRAVHWVHAAGRLTSSGGSSLDLRMTGDCGGVKATFSKQQVHVGAFQAQMHIQGKSKVNGKIQHVSADEIAIISGSHGSIWVRLPQSQGTWQHRTETGNAALVDGLFIYTCTPLLLSYVPNTEWATTARKVHVTESTLHGAPTWRLKGSTAQGATIQNETIVLDRSSLLWLRYKSRQHGGSSVPSSVVLDFSRYGQAVTISPPAK